jgi:adenine-specific DNA-methyltransferase
MKPLEGLEPIGQKEAGAYYTPDAVVSSLVHWAVHSEEDRLLDPSCGDGRLIAEHRNSVGIEQDPQSAALAMARAPWALVHEGDFFTWAAETHERFECAAGNPHSSAIRRSRAGGVRGTGAPAASGPLVLRPRLAALGEIRRGG